MMWPFSKKENRSSFADSISEGDTETPDKRLPSVVPAYVELYPTSADPSKLAIIQTAGNIVYRAFLGADTNIPNNLLPRIARELVLNGEAIAVELDGGLRLIQWPFYDTRGGSSDPNSWAYQLQVSTPRGSKTIYRPGSEIMHFKMNEDALQPWRGQASWKSSTATLLAKIEASLTEQADIPVFQTIRRWGWQSANANTSRSSLVKSALRSRAKILFEFVKSGETPYPSFQVMPEPNAEMVRLRDQLETTLLLQMGIPPSLKMKWCQGQPVGKLTGNYFIQPLCQCPG